MLLGVGMRVGVGLGFTGWLWLLMVLGVGMGVGVGLVILDWWFLAIGWFITGFSLLGFMATFVKVGLVGFG